MIILNHGTLSLMGHADHVLGTFHHNLDMETMLRLKPMMEKALPKVDKPLIIDLAAVHFLDSSAVGVMAILFRHCQDRHLQMSIINANPQPEAVLAMVGLSDYVTLYPDLKSALNALA